MASETLNSSNIPMHIALIPDGNRRWSRLNKLYILKGYTVGIKKFIDFCNWTKDAGIKQLSVWVLSSDNITRRSASELYGFYNLLIRTATNKKILEMLKRNEARVRIIGNKKLLPLRVVKVLENVERITKIYNAMTINLLVGYGGREDIAYAISNMSKSSKAPKTNVKNNGTNENFDSIKSNLMSKDLPDVDLIIRTSGEQRLSGFLPWQSAYSELYFSKKYWPEFNEEDFKTALSDYAKRQRRFGK
ncbi:MAG: polyprenyl diphosphate synthase [Candidatus Micrarchaeia archaeon]